MRLYYINQAEGRRHHVRSALGVNAEVWNALLWEIRGWRRELWERFGIPYNQQIRVPYLVTGRSECGRMLPLQGRFHAPEEGVAILGEGLLRLEEFARDTGGIEIINVCLHKPDVPDYRRVGVDRLFNRINRSVATVHRHAFSIFPPGEEELVRSIYRRMRAFNPVPSRYYLWREGGQIKNMPIQNVIGDPAFRNSVDDWLLQMSHLVAYALLMQEEQKDEAMSSWRTMGGVGYAFGVLDRAINRDASGRDTQGVVRR